VFAAGEFIAALFHLLFIIDCLHDSQQPRFLETSDAYTSDIGADPAACIALATEGMSETVMQRMK
jgi:hypothetical protein